MIICLFWVFPNCQSINPVYFKCETGYQFCILTKSYFVLSLDMTIRMWPFSSICSYIWFISAYTLNWRNSFCFSRRIILFSCVLLLEVSCLFQRLNLDFCSWINLHTVCYLLKDISFCRGKSDCVVYLSPTLELNAYKQ